MKRVGRAEVVIMSVEDEVEIWSAHFVCGDPVKS